jgi:hypothetical protein
MARVVPKIRTGLIPISVFAVIAGCSGHGDHGDDAAPADGEAAAPHTDTPDGAGGLDAGPAGTKGAETNGTVDARPPSVDGGMARETLGPLPATVVVLPDTQYYNADYGHAPVFAMQTNWIIAQKSPLNIQAVLHVGDIVDDCYSVDQWTNASSAMRLLDGVVPYFLVPGNHDVDGDRRGLMNDYFGPASLPWVTSTMTQGQIENNYALVNIGHRQWLVLGIEFGPRNAVMTWADAVLKAYPDRPAIILTHAYLYSDGNRYDVAISGLDSSNPSYQYFIPHSYGNTSSQGINDGEQIWQKLILTNPNVRLVFSGHVTSSTGAARLTSTRPDGSRVHQMLSDYQWYKGDWFGYGYMRVLQFDYSRKTIQVATYSPYMDDYLTDDTNQFTLDLDL